MEHKVGGQAPSFYRNSQFGLENKIKLMTLLKEKRMLQKLNHFHKDELEIITAMKISEYG